MSVMRCASGGVWARACSRPSVVLVGGVEPVLAGVHDVVRVERALDRLHHVVAAAELQRDQVDLAGAGRAVRRGDGAADLQRGPRDVALRVDPGAPRLVVEVLLPDADVDLAQHVAPRLVRPVGVAEHAPVVEDRVALDQPVDDGVPALADLRHLRVRDRRVLAVPRHRRHLAVRRAAVQRRRVPVVPRRPVELRDLVTDVLAARRLRDAHHLLGRRPTSARLP